MARPKLQDQRLIDIATENGWLRIGQEGVEVEEPLTAEEKEQASKLQTDGLVEVERLQNEFGKVKKDFSNKIQGIMIDVNQAAHTLKKGKKMATKVLPTFLDKRRNLKIFFDPDDGAIVREVAPSDDDRQATIPD